MRTLKRTFAVGCALVALAMPVSGFQTAQKFRTLSAELVTAGGSALAKADGAVAQDLFERALVADPANVAALIGLGRSHEVQERVGKGLKYYRQALNIEPNNLMALEAQSLAFLKQNLVDEADDNLKKIKLLCQRGCDELTRVDGAIEAFRVAESLDTADASGK